MLRFGLSWSACVLLVGCLDPHTPGGFASSPDDCAASVEEVDRLVAQGRLDVALREARNGALACGTLPDLREREAEIGRQLSIGAATQTWADARALWRSAAAHEAAGDLVAAHRAYDRALYLAERLTSTRARRTTLTAPQWAGWSDQSAWLAAADRLAGIVRMDLSGDQPVLVAIREADAWLPKLLWSHKHQTMIIPGGQSIGVYNDAVAGWMLPGGVPHLTPDEDTLVVSSRDSVTLYDLVRRTESSTVRTTPDKLAQLAPEGRIVADGAYFASFGLEGVSQSGGRALLVDLERKELLFDQRVRASAASRSGTHLAAIVVDEEQDTPHDKLLLWDLGGSPRAPLAVQLDGTIAEVPSILFDRQELQVQVSYAPASTRAQAARPVSSKKSAASAKTLSSYALSSGERITTEPDRFERGKPAYSSALRDLSGRGYEPLELQPVNGGLLVDPVTASADGSTVVFVEAIHLGSRQWTDPRAVFVDVNSGTVRSRVELKHDLVRLLRIESSADGKWLFACLDTENSGVFVDAVRGTTHPFLGPPCTSVKLSPDRPFALTADGLIHLPTGEPVKIDWEVCRIGPILAPSAVCRE